MVQIGEEVGAREPAVMAVLLNARLLEAQHPVRHWWTPKVYTVRRVVVTQTPVSHLIFLIVLNLVVQAQLDQVEHHAQYMLGHVLMIHPYLEHVKLLVYTEEQVKSSA